MGEEYSFLSEAQKLMNEKDIPTDGRMVYPPKQTGKKEEFDTKVKETIKLEGQNDYPYILVNDHRAVIEDPFIQSINNEILKIYDVAIPVMYIREGGTLIKGYSEEVETTLSKLEGMKTDYIKEHYQINKRHFQEINQSA